MGLLRGPAHGQRPARPPPRVGPGVQGPLPPVPDHAGPRRPPQGRLGLPRPAGGDRGGEGAGLHQQAQIEAYGIDKFNARCRESVQRYVGDWEALTERAGVWIDTKDAYWTLSNDYVESVWWLLKQLYDKGLLYEGHRVIPYCSRCGTALSSHELGQPGAYRDVTDPSVYVRFPVVDRDFDLLVWTTTPWTLISNVAAAVGPEIAYVRVRGRPTAARDLVMAEALAPEGAVVVERFAGAELVGWRYRRPFDLLPIDDRGQRVVGADVRVAPRTGRASSTSPPRSAPTTWRRPGPTTCRCSTRSVPTARSGPTWRRGPGVWVKDADRVDHRRPRRRGACWCGSRPTPTPTPTAGGAGRRSSTGPRRRGSCARRTTAPTCCGRTSTSTGTPTTSSTAASATGWRTTSTGRCPRDRYWGTPLPIWRCERGPRHVRRLGGGAVPAGGARPGRARPAPAGGRRRRLRLPDAGVRRHRAPGSRPCSTPGSTRGRCRRPSTTTRSATGPSSRAAFPADFICEAIDQTRGWFYSLLAVNTLVFGSTPYRNVVCLAHVVDEFGAEDVEVEGQRPRPVARLRHLRRRRPALVLLLRRLAVDQPPGLRGRHPGGHPQDAHHPVERLRLLRHLRRPGRVERRRTTPAARRPRPTATGTRPTPTPTGPRARPVGARPGWRRPSPPSPTPSTTSTPWAGPPPWPPSSTTCRTGTCAGRGPGSGDRRGAPRTRRPSPPSTGASRW